MTEKTNISPRRGRPPKQAEARQGTREQLVRRGIEILCEHGFASTGIEQVLKDVKVPKGSFYYYFPSKNDFGLAVIDGYDAYFQAKLRRWLLDDAVVPLQRLENFIEDAKQGMARFDFRRGCLVGNLGQELASVNDQFRDRLATALRDWQSLVGACLLDAQRRGDLAATCNCAKLSDFFWIGWEGAVLRAKLERSIDPLTTFAEMFFAGLQK